MRHLIVTALLIPMLGVCHPAAANAAEELPDYLKGSTYAAPEFAPGAKVPKFYQESMKTRDERMRWWVDARFGCFVHWGVYAQLAGIWQGEPVQGYSEHIQRKFKIQQADYIANAADQFNPVAFDAEEWIKLIKAAGMRYFVITAKHHDGFAMYDSAVSDWNIIDATPFGRDPMTELKAACDKHGIKFGFYYSHAFDWGDRNGIGNNWEFGRPGPFDRQWWNDPVLGKQLPHVRENYVNQKAIPQVIELLKNYDPDIMWFDTPHRLPNSENWRIFKALRTNDPDVVVNGRFISGEFGDYQTTCDKPTQIRPTSEKYWEAIPTTNESYGHHAMDNSHKPAAELIQLLIKTVARGGNILMNLGPRADGQIDDPDVAILNEFAAWMEVASESIHGAGKSGLPVQAWGESTRKGNTIYLHVFSWPQDGKLRVGGLNSDPASIRILGGSNEVPSTRLDADTLQLEVPLEPVLEVSTVIALQFSDGYQTLQNRLLDPVAVNSLSVFDGKISGDKLAHGRGFRRHGLHSHRDCLENWTKADDYVYWDVYLREAGEYKVTALYHGLKGNAHIEVELGGAELVGTTKAGADVEQELGHLQVPAGKHRLSWHITDTDGQERCRPQALVLESVR